MGHTLQLFGPSLIVVAAHVVFYFVSVPLLSFRDFFSSRVSLCHLTSFWPLHPRGVAAMMAAVH